MTLPRFPLLAKALALGAVTLSLILALDRIDQLVDEREGRLREAQASVAESFASAQVLLGPSLQRRCTERWEVETVSGSSRASKVEQREHLLQALPATLAIDGTVAVEERRRGLFRVNVYTLQATVDASWAALDALKPRATQPNSTLSCQDPVLWVAVKDTRGIGRAEVVIDGAAQSVRPGSPAREAAAGFQVPLPAARIEAGKPLSARVALTLAGTEALSFVPLAGDTQVTLRADWPHPSFNGRFLPVKREIDARGFSAQWQVSALATQAPQQLRAGTGLCAVGGEAAPGSAHVPGWQAIAPEGLPARGATAECIERFGVALIDPVSPYTLADRATKYGLLFIMLTFVAVALVEVMRRLRVHPIQYLLVGSALALFFLLLVSLGEHLPFAPAYAIAAGACTLLLTYYAVHVLKGWGAGLLFGSGIALLYGVLYVLLQLEQTALVMGALLLFAVLAAVMVATRRIDWYALLAQWRGGSATEPRADTRSEPQ